MEKYSHRNQIYNTILKELTRWTQANKAKIAAESRGPTPINKLAAQSTLPQIETPVKTHTTSKPFRISYIRARW